MNSSRDTDSGIVRSPRANGFQNLIHALMDNFDPMPPSAEPTDPPSLPVPNDDEITQRRCDSPMERDDFMSSGRHYMTFGGPGGSYIRVSKGTKPPRPAVEEVEPDDASKQPSPKPLSEHGDVYGGIKTGSYHRRPSLIPVSSRIRPQQISDDTDDSECELPEVDEAVFSPGKGYQRQSERASEENSDKFKWSERKHRLRAEYIAPHLKVVDDPRSSTGRYDTEKILYECEIGHTSWGAPEVVIGSRAGTIRNDPKLHPRYSSKDKLSSPKTPGQWCHEARVYNMWIGQPFRRRDTVLLDDRDTYPDRTRFPKAWLMRQARRQQYDALRWMRWRHQSYRCHVPTTATTWRERVGAATEGAFWRTRMVLLILAGLFFQHCVQRAWDLVSAIVDIGMVAYLSYVSLNFVFPGLLNATSFSDCAIATLSSLEEIVAAQLRYSARIFPWVGRHLASVPCFAFGCIRTIIRALTLGLMAICWAAIARLHALWHHELLYNACLKLRLLYRHKVVQLLGVFAAMWALNYWSRAIAFDQQSVVGDVWDYDRDRAYGSWGFGLWFR